MEEWNEFDRCSTLQLIQPRMHTIGFAAGVLPTLSHEPRKLTATVHPSPVDVYVTGAVVVR